MDAKPFYSQVKDKIPYHQWYNWIKNKFNENIKKN